MNCPHCNETLEFDGDFNDSIAELSGTEEVVGLVEITLICDSCYENLGEYQFELEQDITDFTADHEDEEEHELSVELSNEAFEDTITNGVLYLGACAAVNVSCICGKSVSYQWSHYEKATDVMKELE